MIYKKGLLKIGMWSALILFCSISLAMAKVSSEEAARLGKDLTPTGAERAGNADGTIPVWDGGLKTVPAGFELKVGEFPKDPFAGDPILFTITAQNMDQYADKLSAGQKALFKKYPESYKMHVYQTRRTFANPQWVYDETKKNAVRSYMNEQRTASYENYGGIPFPIPANGAEAITNHGARYGGAEGESKNLVAGIKHPGRKLITGGRTHYRSITPYYWQGLSRETLEKEYDGIYLAFVHNFIGPPRRKGEILMVRAPLDATKKVKAWMYLPGQRRVRRAPNVAYDNPNPSTGGYSFYDESGLFIGEIDRFDFKIVGKREMYVPYNCYRTDHLPASDVIVDYHLNPQYVRWELHRVWEIEGTVRAGKRHAYSKRVLYLDEDSWAALLSDNYDSRGELWRTGVNNSINYYAIPCMVNRMRAYYDLQSDSYGVDAARIREDAYLRFSAEPTYKFKLFTPEEVRRMGRR